MVDISDPGLQGRSALVTGSTSGIGLGIATALAEAGVNVTLNGLGDAQAIERTRADLAERTGVTVRHSGADMSKGDEVVAMVREAESAHGAVDILVNNAGIQFVAPIEEFPAAKWEATFRRSSTRPQPRFARSFGSRRILRLKKARAENSHGWAWRAPRARRSSMSRRARIGLPGR